MNNPKLNRNRDFTMIENFILDKVKFAPCEFTVYAALLRFDYFDQQTKQRKGYSFPSFRTIKNMTNMSNNKLYEALYVLKNVGVIKIIKENKTKMDGSAGKLTRNIYFINEINTKEIDEINHNLKMFREKYRTNHRKEKPIICSSPRNDDVPLSVIKSVLEGGTEKDESINNKKGKKSTNGNLTGEDLHINSMNASIINKTEFVMATLNIDDLKNDAINDVKEFKDDEVSNRGKDEMIPLSFTHNGRRVGFKGDKFLHYYDEKDNKWHPFTLIEDVFVSQDPEYTPQFKQVLREKMGEIIN